MIICRNNHHHFQHANVDCCFFLQLKWKRTCCINKLQSKDSHKKYMCVEMLIVLWAIVMAPFASVMLSQTNGQLHKHDYTLLISSASMLCPIMATLSVRLDPLSDWIQNQYSSSCGNSSGYTFLWWNFSLSKLTLTTDYCNMTLFRQQGKANLFPIHPFN